MSAKKLPKFVAGLGASAGGLEALELFFDEAPKHSGGAYVVVMHLSRDFKSMLDELLARHTRMPVLAATDGDNLEANTVYVIQPSSSLEIRGNKFVVKERPTPSQSPSVTTIDVFFRSLAKSWKENSCGVIFSGSGSDGAEGIKAINRVGGFTCAQAPETAKFDSMPVAAIATSAVHAVESPENIGKLITEAMTLQSLTPNNVMVSDNDFALARISTAIVGLSSVDASQYKNSMFERRVRKRMMFLQIDSLQEYADLIEENSTEAHALSQTLLIGVTEFFRNNVAFKVIEQQIVPELIQRAQSEKRPLRIWTPGCATGQEAYSLAILLHEALSSLPFRLEIQIFATDIKKDYLGEAARGEFTEEQLQSLPDKYRDKYFDFIKGTGRYLVKSDVRKMIIFAPHDVLSDPPFTKLDMVSCRNLLIYFSLEAQHKILSSFAFGLRSKGILFLGSSETVGAHRESFEFIDARNRIFRRTEFKNVGDGFSGPLSKAYRDAGRLGSSARRGMRNKSIELQPAYNALLSQYAPDCLLISAERELLHVFGNARRFLRPPEGVANLDAADMVDYALRTPLVAGLERALRDKTAISFSKIQLAEYPSENLLVDIEVRPLPIEPDDEVAHTLVLITEHEGTLAEKAAAGIQVVSSNELAGERIQELENELSRTREALQSTIEEIETTNEELQSSNEELMSSNEELQSTNEELSSVNEELYSVNAEYHRQNDELNRLNSDFDLLLQSTEIGVIFLDDEMCITKFTALARDMFNLTMSDIGRPISTFRSPFKTIEPKLMVERSRRDQSILEEETVDENNVAWLVRAVNHHSKEGSVLTLINIGRMRDAEIEARRNSEMLGVMQSMMKAFYFELESDLHTISREVGLVDYIGRDTQREKGEIDLSIVHLDDREKFATAIENAKNAKEAEIIGRLWNFESLEHRYVKFHAVKSANSTWSVSGFDIHETVIANEKLIEREAILDAVLKASTSLISYVDETETYVYVNHAYSDMWKTARKNIVGKRVKDFLPEKVYKDALPHIKSVMQGKRQDFIIDNTSDDVADDRRLSIIYQPVFSGTGKVKGFVTSVMDVSRFYDQSRQISKVERMMMATVNHSRASVMLVDVESLEIEYANPDGMMRLGMPPKAILPQGVKITRLTPSWGDRTWKEWLTSEPPISDLHREDVTIFDAKGDSVEADLFAGIVLDEGKLKAMIRVIDNTARNKIVEDLRDRSRELAMSNRDLEQFASVVAHDLSAPLRHITQFSEMVEEEIGESANEDTSEYLDIIKSSADRMSDMVGGLLQYSRIGLSHPEFEDISVKKCVSAAKKLLAGDIEASEASIRVTGATKIFGNVDLITRLFQNLLQNSIKYGKSKTPPKIHIETQKLDDKSIIKFSDNGIGIQAEHANDVFKLFHRLHQDDSYSGLGVGLATCRRIVELHNGTIKLDRSWTEGARFIIELPNEH